MHISCESCPKYHLNEDNFEEDVESSIDTDESDSSNSGNHSIKYYKWMTINGKTSKVLVSLPYIDVLETVTQKIKEVKYHLFVRNEQFYNTFYNRNEHIYNSLSYNYTRMQFFGTLTSRKIMRTRKKVSVSQLTLGTHHSVFSLMLLTLCWME